MRRRRHSRIGSRGRGALAALLLITMLGSPAPAEIYKWVDAQGRVHYTANLGEVPPGQRAAAEAASKQPRGHDRLQTFSAPARAASVMRPAASLQRSAASTWRIRVERAGTSMRVQVRLNDEVTAPFIIDTGASDVVVPKRYVDELGIDLTRARDARYSTANGVITAKLITLDSVSLGGARVEQVPAAVSDSMGIGLLGLSYFNRFQYNIDPSQGLVTLTRNGLEESGHIRGGRSESDWRSEYAQLRQRMRALERRQHVIPSSHSRTHRELEEQMEELERQYRALESEADDARVPFAWRE